MVPSSPTAQPAEARTDLHERSGAFAKNVRAFIRKTPRTIASLSDCRQLIKVSGLIGAHYIEADTADSSQRFVWRMQDCRRAARQCAHWLELLDANLDEANERTHATLLKEAKELDRIFTAIVVKMLRKAKAEKETVPQQ